MPSFQQRHAKGGGKPIGENVNFEQVNRAASRAASGLPVHARDAMALVNLAQAMELHVRAVTALLNMALDDVEGDGLSADDIAYLRGLTALPSAPLFTITKGRR